MKVNVDVLVLNQVRSQPNSAAIINQWKVSENQYQTYIYRPRCFHYKNLQFKCSDLRDAEFTPKYFSPFNLMLIISLFFPRTFNMSRKVKNPIYQPN